MRGQHVHNSFLIQRHVTLEFNRAIVAELLSSHPVKNNKLDILRMIRGVAEDSRLVGCWAVSTAKQKTVSNTLLYLQSRTICSRLRLKYDGTRAETRFRLSTKRTSPFKSTGASVQSTAGSRGASISGSNAGYTMFPGSLKSTGYPLHSPVFPSIPHACVAVCRHISTGLYKTVTVQSRIYTWGMGVHVSSNYYSYPESLENGYIR